jgi:hypothetical protein
LRKFVASRQANSLSIELRGPSGDKLFEKIRRQSPANSLSTDLQGPWREKLFAKIRRQSASKQFEQRIAGSFARQTVRENSSPVGKQTV